MAKFWQGGGLSTAWATGFVPPQELTVEPAWTPNRDLKASYGNGWIRSTSALPDPTGQGNLRIADGTTLPVPLDGAQTAHSSLPPGDAARPSRPGRVVWI